MKALAEKLAKIQRELNAPKSRTNSFGKYQYRSCEDIMSALKPFLDGVYVKVSDEIVNIGDRYYVKATAVFSDGENSISNTALAREADSKKGMDDSQLTGATSSYARKYALGGLFLADDTQDADSHDNSAQGVKSQAKYALDDVAKQWIEFIKSDPSGADQIKDIEYRKFILSKVGK